MLYLCFIKGCDIKLNGLVKKLSMEELGRLDAETYKSSPKIPLVVVLDNIRSQQNTGSVFRTGDAYRIEALYLCGITATPPHREIHRSALGATETVDWRYFHTTREAIADLRSKGYTIAGIEQMAGSVSLNDFKVPGNQPLAVIFGNEVEGLSEDILQELDLAIELPQYGTKHSLNISVCAGIVIWNIFNQFVEQGPEAWR